MISIGVFSGDHVKDTRPQKIVGINLAHKFIHLQGRSYIIVSNRHVPINKFDNFFPSIFLLEYTCIYLPWFCGWCY